MSGRQIVGYLDGREARRDPTRILVTNLYADQCSRLGCRRRPEVLVGPRGRTAVCRGHVGIRVVLARLDTRGRIVS